MICGLTAYTSGPYFDGAVFLYCDGSSSPKIGGCHIALETFYWNISDPVIRVEAQTGYWIDGLRLITKSGRTSKQYGSYGGASVIWDLGPYGLSGASGTVNSDRIINLGLQYPCAYQLTALPSDTNSNGLILW